MAISLNNHETRIKALEDTKGKTSITKLWSGPETWSGYRTISLSKSASEFDFICFVTKELSNGWCRNYQLIPTKVIKFTGMSAIANPVSGESNSGIRFQWLSDRELVERYCLASWEGFLEIYGLKLYYSFSYNIIYKILRSKISRLCQFFTLLKQKECEIKWL